MQARRTSISWLAMIGLLCWAGAGQAQQTTAAPSPELAKERELTRLGLAAKLLASAVFISGRDPDRVVAEDFVSPAYGGHDWKSTKIEVDRAKGRVTLSTAKAGARTAVFTGPDAQGVVLLPIGETSLRFTPRKIPRQQPSGDLAWPWGERIDPSARPRGIDEDALRAAVAIAFEDPVEAPRQQTRAIVVIHKGQLVAERYAPGFRADQPLIGWSMGKTITAALLGIVSSWEPKLDLQAPAPIAEWQKPQDPRAQITVANLMNMSAGLSCPSPGIDDPDYSTPRNVHNSVYYGIADAHAMMLSRPLQDPPGSRWQYRNVNTFGLAHIVRERVKARGLDYLAFPQHALFDRIGARSFVLETDLAGNFLITGFNYATARDWARFGEFLRRDGVGFDGTRALPTGWVGFMRKPAPSLKEPYYGGQVWLNADGMFKSLPRDAYFARGAMEQIVLVIPSRETVVVRLGATPDEATMWKFYPHFEQVVASALKALPASPPAAQ